MRVEHDVVHTGTVTLIYGAVQRQYSWVAGTMTAAHIYTFPSSFTFVPSNAYGTGFHLKEKNLGTLQLKFVGGDLLHSANAAAQVSYVTYTQGTTTNTVTFGSLTLPDTVAISLTPVNTTALTLSVQLKGPDGTPGGVMTAIVPSTQIASAAPSWAPTGVVGPGGMFSGTAGVSSDVYFQFTANENFPANAAQSFTATANGAPMSLSSAWVSGKTLVVPFAPPYAAAGWLFKLTCFEKEYEFTLLSTTYWTIEGFGQVGTSTKGAQAMTLRTKANASGYTYVRATAHANMTLLFGWTGSGYNQSSLSQGGTISDGMEMMFASYFLPSGTADDGVVTANAGEVFGFYIRTEVAATVCQITFNKFRIEYV
jgi:hypothetical protein